MKYTDEEIIAIIQKRLSANRYQHSLRVAEVARRLAEQYRVDPGQAYTTGLLHDYAKGLSGQQWLPQYPPKRAVAHSWIQARTLIVAQNFY